MTAILFFFCSEGVQQLELNMFKINSEEKGNTK